MTEPGPESVIDISGPPSQSLFRHMLAWAVLSKGAKDDQAKADADLQGKIDADLAHVTGLRDDRLLVLLGAMIVENAQDSVLAAVMPGFKTFRENRDATFSIRTEVLRAMALIPDRLLRSTDLIRQIRNEFAHELTSRSFAQVNLKYRDAMRTRLREFNDHFGKDLSDSDVFRELTAFTSLALHAYERMVRGFSQYVRDPKFHDALREFMEARGKLA